MGPILQKHPDAQGIVFLGDGLRDLTRASVFTAGKQVIAVRGNTDTAPDGTLSFAGFSIDGIRIAAMHGHEQMVKLSDSMLHAIAEQGYRLILHGHTHARRKVLFHTSGGRQVTVCCPGAVCEGQFALLSVENGQFELSFKE